MNIATIANISDLKDKIYEALQYKKNLMVYDMQVEKYSDIDENIAYRYFYSNPYDALEFITLDIFDASYNRQDKYFGILTIIRDRIDFFQEKGDTIYGNIEIQKIRVRDVDKNKIKLFINNKGIEDIDACINYFEDKFCIK